MANSADKTSVTTRLATLAMQSVFTALSLLPLGVLYIFSSFLAWLAHSVVRYRRKVVSGNLHSCLPEKTPAEIRQIERAFYRYLTDYFFETIKLTTMSRKQIRRRMRFEGIDEIDSALARGRDVSLLLGHYGNWEWISSIPLHLKSDSRCGQIYHPLENKAADSVFLRLRQRCGAISIKMADTLPTLRLWHSQGIPSVTGYIADQAPGFNGIHLWLDFLNHDTAVYTGPERISRMLDAEVFYVDVVRPKRGYYTARFVKITDNPASMERFAISRRYFFLLEQTIRRRPELWLWSHRRWKRTRRQFEDYFGDDASRQLQRL